MSSNAKGVTINWLYKTKSPVLFTTARMKNKCIYTFMYTSFVEVNRHISQSSDNVSFSPAWTNVSDDKFICSNK